MVGISSGQTPDGDLSGPWRVQPMSLELKRSGADGDLDDSDWIEVPVPGHWGQVQEFENHNGPMLYRRRFTHPPTTQDQRLWLRFNGVLSEAEVWLDGQYLSLIHI